MRFWRGDAQSLEDAELSVELLQRTYPKLLSSWVLVGIYAVFVGYGMFAAAVRSHIISRPRVLMWMRRSFAGAFAALGVKLALTDR